MFKHVIIRRFTALPWLLSLLLLAAQVGYAFHDGDTLGGHHVHSLECAICLSKHASSAILPSVPFVVTETVFNDVVDVSPNSVSRVHRSLFAIRAPPQLIR